MPKARSEYCEKNIDGTVIRDMQLQFGSCLLEDLRVAAIIDVADGIQYLHENGVIHGDIKPLNVLVCGNCSDEYIFKVTDYACFGNKRNACASSKSISVKQLMTPAYMVPELFSNEGCYQSPMRASDIYSLGSYVY